MPLYIIDYWGDTVDTNEEFFFGDASDNDLEDSEEILISESTVVQSKKAPPRTCAVKKTAIAQVSKQSHPINISTVSSEPNKIHTVQQAATYLQLRTETILRKIYSGELGAFKVGKIWRIKQSQIDNYLHNNISNINKP